MEIIHPYLSERSETARPVANSEPRISSEGGQIACTGGA